ncbi:helix-turn-helix transcriptional regulator [Luteococcus peritonei]|uniref:Helix-turn-helix transcriptional regulator n=1 Tax=Luteococcus peritonei TaxID=88874 RepID=A0ABW4RZ53_9ACTN
MSAARAAVLEAVRTRGRLCSVREVADQLDLHPNTVREHLDALLEQRLVERESSSPAGRGRPALMYRATTAITDVARDYELLAEVLAEQLAQLPDAAGASRAAGRSWGSRLGHGDGEPVELQAWMAQLGFQPHQLSQATWLLRSCPILSAARQNPDVVCSVHLGLAQAIVERQGQDGSQMAIEPMGHPQGCLLHLRAPQLPTEPMG